MATKMPFVKFNERDSEYYRNLALLRKNPYKGFKNNPEFAKAMSAKAQEAKRKKKRVLHKEQLLQNRKSR